MEIRHVRPRRAERAWRAFTPREGRVIEHAMRSPAIPFCPRCGELLEAEPGGRLRPEVAFEMAVWDIVCRECRRFWCLVRRKPRSVRVLRMRRLAAAVQAAGVGGPGIAAGYREASTSPSRVR